MGGTFSVTKSVRTGARGKCGVNNRTRRRTQCRFLTLIPFVVDRLLPRFGQHTQDNKYLPEMFKIGKEHVFLECILERIPADFLSPKAWYVMCVKLPGAWCPSHPRLTLEPFLLVNKQNAKGSGFRDTASLS
jgi:hypothetical protein